MLCYLIKNVRPDLVPNCLQKVSADDTRRLNLYVFMPQKAILK